MNYKKLSVVFIILLVFASYFIFDLGRYAHLDFLKQSNEFFVSLYNEYPLLTIAIFFILYVIVAAFSLPGAAIMTLAAGYLFGFWTGTLITSFASSLGALLAMIVSRYLLREWVEEKFGSKINVINRGIQKEGAFYLFTLRLVPIFPFFMINLIMGITKMPLKTFYWVSQIGMLPGTAVYVFAGKQLSQISSISDIFSLELILAFVLIGIFPYVTKKAIEKYKGKSLN